MAPNDDAHLSTSPIASWRHADGRIVVGAVCRLPAHLRTSTIRVRGEGTVQAEPDRSSRRYSGNAITVAGAGRQRGADFFPQFIPVQSAITITFAAHPQSTHDR
jgi:hypothetical protein